MFSFLVALFTIAAFDYHLPPSRGEVRASDSLELALLRGAIMELRAEAHGKELWVDPRPLRADPNLVTSHIIRAALDRVDSSSWRSRYADLPAEDLEHRRKILLDLGVTPSDGLPFEGCPGNLVPPTPAVIERQQRSCPSIPVHAAVVALSRPDGAYWPRNVDERTKYVGRQVCSVRVITRELSPMGRFEWSADYIFECGPEGVRFLEKRTLLIVE